MRSAVLVQVPRVPAGSAAKLTAAAGVVPGLALLVSAAVFASWACFQQFGGYDLSPLIDAFWRTRIGQVPGVDYINTFPPLIFLSAKLAALFNLGWYELTALAILHTGVAFGVVMLMTSSAERTFERSMIVAAVLSLPLIYTNHLWHSSSSQLVGATFVYALHRSVVRVHPTAGDLIWIAAMSALLTLSKQNVALPLFASALLAVSVTAGTSRLRLVSALVLGAGAGLAAGLWLVGMSLASFVETYTAVLGRGIPTANTLEATLQIRSSLVVIGALAAALALMAIRLLQRRAFPDKGSQLLILLLPAALYPLATDWDAKMNDVVLPLFLVCCWAWSDAQVCAAKGQRGDLTPLWLVVGFLFVLALCMGFTRERMYNVGPGTFWEARADHRIADGYFAGMHTGKRLDNVLQEARAFKSAYPPSSVFFGPRLEFGYRELGAAPPRNLPLWWHPGSSYALSAQGRVIAAFAASRFDHLLFLGNDRTRMPQQLLLYIKQHYRQLPGRGELQVFERLPTGVASRLRCRLVRSDGENDAKGANGFPACLKI